eukprot:31431-Pelagococcus_subviridis.AAC.9
MNQKNHPLDRARTRSNASRNTLACFGVKYRPGRHRIVRSPHVAMSTPSSLSASTASSRAALESKSTAVIVPTPRTLCSFPACARDNACKPSRKYSPHRLEHQNLPRVPHPRVKHAVRRVRHQVRLGVVPRDLHLLREGHRVRRVVQAPLLVRPKRAARAAPGLHLVDDELHPARRALRAQRPKERPARVIVPALALHGLHDHADDVRIRVQEFARLLHAPRLLRRVVRRARGIVQGISQPRERRDRPLERGNVQLVRRLAVRQRQARGGSPVERAVKRQKLVRLTPRRAVHHARAELLLGDVPRAVSAAFASPSVRDRDVHLLHRVLVRARPAHLRRDVRQPSRRH